MQFKSREDFINHLEHCWLSERYCLNLVRVNKQLNRKLDLIHDSDENAEEKRMQLLVRYRDKLIDDNTKLFNQCVLVSKKYGVNLDLSDYLDMNFTDTNWTLLNAVDIMDDKQWINNYNFDNLDRDVKKVEAQYNPLKKQFDKYQHVSKQKVADIIVDLVNVHSQLIVLYSFVRCYELEGYILDKFSVNDGKSN